MCSFFKEFSFRSLLSDLGTGILRVFLHAIAKFFLVISKAKFFLRLGSLANDGYCVCGCDVFGFLLSRIRLLFEVESDRCSLVAVV